MRKLIFVGLVAGVFFAAHSAARADTLSDWIASLFSWDVNNGPTPADGPGSGTGIAD